MSRYWYGNDGGFSVSRIGDVARRPVPPSAEGTRNGSGPVRVYPRQPQCAVEWVAGEPENLRRVGRPTTYLPELSRAEAKRQRERARYAAMKEQA